MKGACQARKQAAPAILLSVLTILALATPLVAASSMYERLAARVGTIPWMKTQQPGAVITLDAMMVDEIGDGFLIVKEPCLITEKVRVEAYARVEKWRSVEVTGTIALDAESRMYVKDARVYVYADSKGHIMPIVPKSIQAPRDYWTKIDVTLSGPDPTPPAKERTQPPMMMDSMTGFNPDVTPLAAIKLLPDGTRVEVRNKWVSSVWWWGDSENVSYPTFWVEEADRSAGIKVIGDQFGRDSLASFTATLATMDGQRVLKDVANVSDIWPPSNFMPPPSLGMPCKTVGGPPLNGAHKFSGLDNTARLVTTWGNVVSCAWGQTGGGQWVDYVNIDDGSGVPMRVEVPETVQPYSGMIRVTGISDTIRRSNDMYNVNYDPLPDLPDLLDDYVRRIVCRNYNDVVTPGGAPGPAQQGTVSGHLIANESPADPVSVYTANGWVKALPSQWQLVGSQYKAPYTVSGVPGNASKVGLISAKGLGYASGYAFATPGSANVDISLTDTSVRRLDLADPNPATVSCGQSSQIAVHFWESEMGYNYADETVRFTAINGKFPGDLTETDVVLDQDGAGSVTVTPTGTGNIIVTALALGVQSQKVVWTTRERLSLWSDPPLDDPGGTATVYAKLWDASGQVIQGATITFTAESGGSLDPLTASTNSQGVAQTTFTRASGNPKVRATYTGACGWQVSEVIDTTPANNWSMFQHDIAHTGVTQASISANLTKKWRIDLAGKDDPERLLWSSPVVADGWVYVGTNNPEGTLYAIKTDGTDMRSVDLGTPISGTPCVSGGRVFVGTEGMWPDDGVLHVLYAQSLEPDWNVDFPGQRITGGITVWNGAAYFGTDYPGYLQPGALHTVDLTSHADRTGSPAYTPWGVWYTAPAIDVNFSLGARCYVSDYSCGLTAVECGTGAYAWSPAHAWEPDQSSFFSSPTAYGGYIFGGSTAPYAYRLMDHGNSYLPLPTPHFFSPSGMGGVYATLTALNGKLFFGDSIHDYPYYGNRDGNMYRLGATSFTQQQGDWTVNLGSPISSSALISQPTDLLFTCTEDGKVHGLNITNGSEAWSYSITDISQLTSKSSLAASGGRLFAVMGNSGGRYLYCFGE